MRDVTPGWKHVAIVPEGGVVELEGLKPWDHDWHRLHEPEIIVAHPSYPNQRHPMWVYELRVERQRVKFAAGEYSSNVWGFYVPAGRSGV
jgi:hypothetical protein